MQLYERRCKYFYSKLNVNQLVTQAEQLYKIAKGNNDVYYQSMANIYLAEAFSINGLHDKAMVYLNENLAITKNSKEPNNSKIFFARVNTLTSLTNLYNDQ